jgi:recombination protein RecA
MPRDKKTTEESSKTLEEKIKDLNKKFGRDIINNGLVTREKVSSGILTMDYLMQYMYEKRSLILLHGHEGSLKTTIALIMLAEAQRRGENCLIIDIEKGFDKERAKDLGVDVRPNHIHVVDEPLSAEGYLELMCEVINDFTFILVDSTTSMVSQQIADKSLTEGVTRASLASALSSGLGKLNYKNKNSTVVMIGQERDNPSPTGAPTYLPGGKAQKFYANYRFQFKVVEYYDEDGNVVGKTINQVNHKPIVSCLLKITNKKNRRGEQQMVEELLFNFKTGKIDKKFEVVKIAKRLGIIESGGSWMVIPGADTKMQQTQLMGWLEDEKNYNSLRNLIDAKLKEI